MPGHGSAVRCQPGFVHGGLLRRGAAGDVGPQMAPSGGEAAGVPRLCCPAAPASPGQSPSRVPVGPVSPATCSAGCVEPPHGPGHACG